MPIGGWDEATLERFMQGVLDRQRFAGTKILDRAISDGKIATLPGAKIRPTPGTAQALTGGQLAAVTCGTTDYDSDHMVTNPVGANPFAVAGGGLTIKTAGRYLITGQIGFILTAPGIFAAAVVVYPNSAGAGSNVGEQSQDVPAGGNGTHSQNFAVLRRFQVNDLIQLCAYSGPGGTNVTPDFGAGGTEASFFAAQWVSP